jgi:nicotinamidase-related amidase
MLKAENTLLLIVDVQGKLALAMHDRERLFENLAKVIKGAKILDVPILVTEQNPQGLGPTISEIADLLADDKKISKFSFSCCDNESFVQALDAIALKNIAIAGIESHICVYQTAKDLLKFNYGVHIITDAVSSRTKENKQLGIESSKNLGAALTSVEMLLFELVKDAQKSEFKEILNIVK